MAKHKNRWLHYCHKRSQELVMQGEECPYCGRTRTVQAEARYADATRSKRG